MFGEQTFAQLRTGLTILTILAQLLARLGETHLSTKGRVIIGIVARHPRFYAISEVSSIGTLSRNAHAVPTFEEVAAVVGVGIIPGLEGPRICAGIERGIVGH